RCSCPSLASRRCRAYWKPGETEARPPLRTWRWPRSCAREESPPAHAPSARSDSLPRMSEREADALVVFGITGDLARKQTFRSLYRLDRRGLLPCPVIGVASTESSDDQLRERARQSIKETGEQLDDEVWHRFAARLEYVQGDFDDAQTYTRLGEALRDRRDPVFYLEIPPSLFGMV